MCSFVEEPIDPMIAELKGSTAVPVIGVFHALLAGNGRLIEARSPVDVDCLWVVAVPLSVVAAAVTCTPEADADAEATAAVEVAVAVPDADREATPLSRVGAAWSAGVAAPGLPVPACVQPPRSIATVIRAAGSAYWRGCRTSAG
jgi:hypothetical protein